MSAQNFFTHGCSWRIFFGSSPKHLCKHCRLLNSWQIGYIWYTSKNDCNGIRCVVVFTLIQVSTTSCIAAPITKQWEILFVKLHGAVVAKFLLPS